MSGLYKIQIGVTNGPGGTSEVHYFEDRERFEDALTAYVVQAHAHWQAKPRLQAEWAARLPKKYHRREGDWRVDRIFKVQQRVGDEWVDLEWHLTPPKVEVGVWGT